MGETKAIYGQRSFKNIFILYTLLSNDMKYIIYPYTVPDLVCVWT